MGMYTGYKGDFKIRADAPAEVLATLRFMTSDSDDEPAAPNHAFFATYRPWWIMGGCSSYFEYGPSNRESGHHVDTLTADDGTGVIHYAFFSSTKGSCEDLALFFQWLLPYLVVEGDAPVMLGQALYEEASQPLIVFYHRGNILSTLYSAPPDPDAAAKAGYGFGMSYNFDDDIFSREAFTESGWLYRPGPLTPDGVSREYRGEWVDAVPVPFAMNLDKMLATATVYTTTATISKIV